MSETLPGFVAGGWNVLLAPKGTPMPVVNKLNESVRAITSQPAVQAEWARQGATALVMDAAAFDKYVRDDIQKWAQVIHSAHIKVD